MGAAVDDPMAHAEHPRAAVPGAQPPGEHAERRAAVANGCLQFLIGNRSVGVVPAVRRGEVPMPSIWPRTSSRQVSSTGRRYTQNFRLEEPAFKTRA